MEPTTDYITCLEASFTKAANQHIATQQMAYMRHQFVFYGIKAADRRVLQKPFLVKAYLPAKHDLNKLIIDLWSKPARDFQLFGQELVQQYQHHLELEDIAILEYMVTHKSWWDTVDFIAINLMGPYFKKFPEQRAVYVQKWLASNHIWLQRSALLFQLKYKDELDTVLLALTINALLGSKEFFINKAIGWVLRQYSRTNPYWVSTFVEQTPLENLSRKEALRLLN